MQTHRTFIAGLLLRVACAAHADGGLDPTWGSHGQYPNGGREKIPVDLGGNKTDQAFGTALQADGRLVIAGSASVFNSAYPTDKDIAVTRLRTDGTIDPSFGNHYGTFIHNFNFPGFCGNEDVAHAVAIDHQDRIVVVGTAECSADGAGTSSLFVLRLLPTGVLDVTFGTEGIVLVSADQWAYGGTAVALYFNRIFAAGFGETGLNPRSGPIFFEFDDSGTLVTEHGLAMTDPGSTATGISVDAFGSVTLSGFYKASHAYVGVNATNGFDCFIARFVLNVMSGTYAADAAFGSNGFIGIDAGYAGYGDGFCHAHAIDTQGRIVIIGESSKDDNGGTFAFASRYTANGQSDPDFPPPTLNHFGFEIQDNVIGAINSPRAVAIEPDNRIVIAGYGTVNSAARAPFDFAVMRLLDDGDLDQGFRGSEPGSRPGVAMIGFETSSSGSDDGAFALTLDSANRLYVVGQHQVSGSNYDMAVARLQSDAIFIDGFESP